jgi:hypothetical protein
VDAAAGGDGGAGKKRQLAFFDFLSGEEGIEQPVHHLVGIVAEIYHCRPSEAFLELNEHYDDVMQVLWHRNFARAKDAYDRLDTLSADAKRELEADPMVQLVKKLDFIPPHERAR